MNSRVFKGFPYTTVKDETICLVLFVNQFYLSLCISAEELLRALLLWMFDHLMWISLFNNHSTVHKNHMVCNISCKCHLMCDNDHRCLLVSQTADYLQHLTGKLRVQCRSRLIKTQDVRLQCKSPHAAAVHRITGADSDPYALLIPYGQAIAFHARQSLPESLSYSV